MSAIQWNSSGVAASPTSWWMSEASICFRRASHSIRILELRQKSKFKKTAVAQRGVFHVPEFFHCDITTWLASQRNCGIFAKNRQQTPPNVHLQGRDIIHWKDRNCPSISAFSFLRVSHDGRGKNEPSREYDVISVLSAFATTSHVTHEPLDNASQN